MATTTLNAPQGLGPSFLSELVAAGAAEGVSVALSRGLVNVMVGRSVAQLRTVDAVIKAHDPTAPGPLRENETLVADLKAAIADGNLTTEQARAQIARAEKALAGT